MALSIASRTVGLPSSGVANAVTASCLPNNAGLQAANACKAKSMRAAFSGWERLQYNKPNCASCGTTKPHCCQACAICLSSSFSVETARKNSKHNKYCWQVAVGMALGRKSNACHTALATLRTIGEDEDMIHLIQHINSQGKALALFGFFFIHKQGIQLTALTDPISDPKRLSASACPSPC